MKSWGLSSLFGNNIMRIFPALLPVLRRFDECSKTLTLVATHSRDSFVVTALALSPDPFFANVVGDLKETKEGAAVPLVALADRTTKTVAVLAFPRFGTPRSTTSSQNSPTPPANTNGTDRNSGCSSDRGDGYTSNAVGHLRLLSLWPCRDKVVSLVASSQAPALPTSDSEGPEDEDRGGNEERHQQQNQQDQRQRQPRHTDKLPSRYFRGSWKTAGEMFVACTASGQVWEFGLDAPVCISGV